MTKPTNRVRFLVLYAAYAAIYVARVNLSLAGPGLIAEGVWDAAHLGLLGSVFSLVYAVGRLANGAIGDAVPPWGMLTVGLLVSGLSNLSMGFLPPPAAAVCLWTANAYAQSMLWSAILRVLVALYDKKEAPRKTSLMVTSVAAGNIGGILINTALIARWGERYAFWGPGLLTLVLGGAVLGMTRPVAVEKPTRAPSSFRHLFQNKTVLKMCVPALIHGVMKDNISLWMAAYMVERYAVDLQTSSLYILLIPTIGFVGRLLYAPLFRWCRERENRVSFIGFVLCAAMSLLLFTNRLGMAAAAVAMGMVYAAVSLINTSLLSVYPLRYAETGQVASVSGIMDFATYCGAGLTGVLYGVVIKAFGYGPMFLSWAVLAVVSLLVIGKR